jgi:valyl-tRNA synthetase/predicted alpha/beta hydrolase family esterase
MSLSPNYNPKQHETDIYTAWQTAKIGNPELQKVPLSRGQTKGLGVLKTHSILMPPPNLTGNLHAGHAFGHYTMDTLSRLARQRGETDLWFPGVDHAGLQMEGVMDKLFNKGEFDEFFKANHPEILQWKQNNLKENYAQYIKKNHREIALECFWKKVNEWRNNQKEQSAILGDTPDYDRTLFTLDPQNVEMVNYAFQKYWQDGLIYKGSYLVNWSVGLMTALSDVAGEIEYEKRIDPFVTFKYRLFEKNSPLEGCPQDGVLFQSLENSILVSTVRPETVFGDYAVAVHPEVFEVKYSQYKQLLDSGNLFVEIPLTDRKIPVILAKEVDPNFGSGALKITPAHDIVDYEIFNKYIGGDFEQAIGRDGKLTNICGKYAGMTVTEGRLAVIKDMVENDLVPKKPENQTERKDSKNYFSIEFADNFNPEDFDINWNYEHNVTICERSKTVVEPLISEEFFLSWNKELTWKPTAKTVAQTLVNTGRKTTLAKLGKEAVNKTNFYSPEYKERGLNFLDNIKDWCISRDLIWGHTMPVWYNLDTNPERKFWSFEEMNCLQNQYFAISTTKPTTEGNWVQEEKILDTWFSSCLWPLSTLNYPEFLKNQTKKSNLVIIHGGIDEHDRWQQWLESGKSNTYWFGKAPADGTKPWKATIRDFCEANYIDCLAPSLIATKAKYEDWKVIFEKAVPYINSNTVLVGHSLGSMFLARYISENKLDYKSVFLVAGARLSCDDNSSFVAGGDLSILNNSKTYIIHSQDDDVVSFQKSQQLAGLLPSANFVELDGYGHLNGSCEELETLILDKISNLPTREVSERTEGTNTPELSLTPSSGGIEGKVTDFEQFYPTQEMVTGKDIFYQWIVRMTTLGYYFTAQIPYTDLVITPTVLDDKGKKMSKSLNNGMDPVAQINKYSSDALRMALLGGMIPDRNMKMGGRIADELCEKYRNFGNKMWNVARFFEYQEEKKNEGK